jgi:uncharacterized protein
MYARPFIDSLDFAVNGKQIDTQVPFAELARMHDVLDSPLGELHYTLQGGLDSQGRAVLDISMTGNCQLRCQRCLSGLDYRIEHQTRLLLCDQATIDALDSGRQLDEHPDEDEEVEAILADEILLNLPISPMHDSGACQVAEGEDTQKGKLNPFAVLENLKRN